MLYMMWTRRGLNTSVFANVKEKMGVGENEFGCCDLQSLRACISRTVRPALCPLLKPSQSSLAR